MRTPRRRPLDRSKRCAGRTRAGGAPAASPIQQGHIQQSAACDGCGPYVGPAVAALPTAAPVPSDPANQSSQTTTRTRTAPLRPRTGAEVSSPQHGVVCTPVDVRATQARTRADHGPRHCQRVHAPVQCSAVQHTRTHARTHAQVASSADASAAHALAQLRGNAGATAARRAALKNDGRAHGCPRGHSRES